MMRPIGHILMLSGFFAAALITVRHADSAGLEWATIEWLPYLLCFGVGVVGVVLLRVSAHSDSTQAHKIDDDLRTIDRTLGELVSKLKAITARQDAIDVYDIHAEIDRDLVEPLNAFVDARESLIHAHGLQPYANLMSEFANAERNINRSWSASVDGYIDEVVKCMEQAFRHMSAAQRLYQQYSAASGEGRV